MSADIVGLYFKKTSLDGRFVKTNAKLSIEN
jgi:hypothetical protein